MLNIALLEAHNYTFRQYQPIRFNTSLGKHKWFWVSSMERWFGKAYAEHVWETCYMGNCHIHTNPRIQNIFVTCYNGHWEQL